MLGRFDRLRSISGLDPVTDHCAIYRLSFACEFPWEYRFAGQFALLRLFCAPSIAELLVATRVFSAATQKRYDNTAILLTELAHSGYDSSAGRQAIRNMNRVHRRYDIANEDMLYVLGLLVHDLADWVDRFGWRRLSSQERLATFHFYREVGRRMNIRDIPACPGELLRFKLDYEQRNFRRTESSKQLGAEVLEMACSWYPWAFRGLMRTAALAIMDPAMSEALDLPRPGRAATALVRAVLALRSAVVRRLPARRGAAPVTRARDNHSYPGYPATCPLSGVGSFDTPAGIDPKWLRQEA